MERMRAAAYGLALRGHEVLWLGAGVPESAGLPPPTLRVTHRHPLLLTYRADLALGGSSVPFRTILYAAITGAHAAVLSLDPELMKHWSLLDRWAWESIATAGMCEASDRAAVEESVPQSVPERLRSWPLQPHAEADAYDIAHPDTDALERWCERWVARQRGAGEAPGAFLDRDGTVVEERGYLVDIGDLVLFPSAPEAVRTLQAAGYRVVLISNQSGVGRGLFPLGRVHEAMALLRRALRERGVELDAIYFCPHRPEAGCECRKPGTALLENAATNLTLSLRRSAMVGDKLIDVVTAHRAGALGVLVRTGYGRDEEQRSQVAEEDTSSIANRNAAHRSLESGAPAPIGITDAQLERPDEIVDDVADAANWIVTRGERLVE
jgi:D-glycero-D-manno-heptose 1,7-bisphosphate phosphatase